MSMSMKPNHCAVVTENLTSIGTHMNQQPPTSVWFTLAGTVDNQMVQRVFQSFAAAMQSGVKDAHILIQSSGGFVGDGIAIYNYLSNLPINITTYNAGSVSSIAVLVFLAGVHRVASETSTFMIHKTHASPPPGATAAVLKELIDSLNIDNANTESILHRHIHMPPEKWDLHQHGNLIITAEEAKQFELVHELGPFSPSVDGQLFNIVA